MDLTEEIDQVASRAEDQVEHIESEEATKHALIIPFIKALGYDPYDLQEVIPEFTADFAEQKGEKVDYALMQEGEPAVLIECKTAGKELSIDQAAQLFRYFQVTEARFGLLTNGVRYRFFSDLEESNKMDERPFHELNLFEYNDQEVEELKSLRNSTFDLDQMIDAAHDLKYRKALREYLEEQWQNPEDEFVHWLTDKVYDGRITQNVRNQFRDIVEGALHQLVHDKVRGRLSSALQEEQASAAEELSPPEEEEEEQLPEGVVRVDGEVVTLEEELEGFRIVQAILREVVDVDRVAERDLKSYFNVLLDDTNRQPICRFHFHSKTKRIGLFDEEKNEERIQIETLDDIYDHADHLRKTVQFYEDNK
ncbi:hypothetical protein GGP49_000836 [Salinibacter ruber]|uniref:type I restriction endonuclease n=1 Tax=Salinibacter ruber TaxID=146919 RepID=UPI002167E502|nr:type I restriction endonuclease [Salinibacter ruber]MCS4113922.1 hypothetical protein [Salinibacter ruber]